MDEKHTQQFAQNSSERASLVPSEDFDFLSLLAGVQSYETNQAEANQAETSQAETNHTENNQYENNQPENATAEAKSNEEKHRHHLWHRLSANQKDNKNKDAKNKDNKGKDNSKDTQSSANSAPHFTPLPSAPKPTDFGIFDTRDGQIFDSAMRLRLHTLIATCLMNGICDSRINAFMHLLQWPDFPKIVIIAGTFGKEITPDDGPNRKPAPVAPADNTDALRRNIWPQLGSCNAYDAIVERVQSSALQRISKAWQATKSFAKNINDSAAFATPSHIILLAVREEPSEQALEKICSVFAPSKKPICVSSLVEGVGEISSELTATLASIAVAPAVKHLPQIIHTDDVLPERALIGDSTAFNTLYNKVYQSLAPYSNDDPTLETIDMFLRFGGALDQTAHELNVHPNTVRYRLRKVAQTTGWDATDPRAAYVLQTAITIGRIRDSH
ncbi:regulator [Gardnerella vaginalis]|uniref:Regulator n=1 Tax=Gardnerella vaginalis TaxID=2702 RepID=A0A3E1IRS7_GARVA|nr:helix-turn-helix domain-containing protein [Gardnerella vaginalis]RFD75434.1 regulator [Gardnerella vaginalis]